MDGWIDGATTEQIGIRDVARKEGVQAAVQGIQMWRRARRHPARLSPWTCELRMRRHGRQQKLLKFVTLVEAKMGFCFLH